jgi:hypothetical protein
MGPCLCGDPECGRCFPQQAAYYDRNEAANIVDQLRGDAALRDEVFSNFCRGCNRYLNPHDPSRLGGGQEICYCERDD